VSQDATFGVPAQVRRHLSSQLVIVGVGPVEEGLEVVRNRKLSFEGTSPNAMPMPLNLIVEALTG
jgi:hypothetical protein